MRITYPTNQFREFSRQYIKAQWSTAKHNCTSYGTEYVKQQKYKFLNIIPYWKTISIR